MKLLFSDGLGHRPRRPLLRSSALYESLNDCATEGAGFGVSDLQEALNHMAENNDQWTDDNTTSYFGGPGKSYKHGYISDMPEGCANFLSAVD